MNESTRQHLINVAGGLVAVTIMGNLSFLAWALVFKEIPKSNEMVLVQFIGNLTGFAGLIVGFYFGSSSTSKKQSDTIDKLADTTKAAQDMPAPVKTDATVTLEAGESANVQAEK
jgi:hypothetical protein